jgi:hypothetical protein
MMKLQELRSKDARVREKLKDVRLKDVKEILTRCGGPNANAADLIRCIFTSAFISACLITCFRGLVD